MKRTAIVAALAALACAPLAPEPAHESPPREVFDGRSLAGWDGDPRFWSVEGGAIVGRSTPENPCTETTYLIWRGGEVVDFELTFEFRIEGGNSGVQFRSRETAQWQVAGYQADIEDGPSWTGCLYEQDGRGVIATRGERVLLGPGSRQAIALDDAAALLAHVRPHDWNEYAIRAVGERIELSINGVRTVEVADRDPERARASGLVALQLHAGAPMRVAFRNFRLRELPSEPRAPAPVLAGVAGGPQWIWTRATALDGERAAFTVRFEAPAGVERAILRGAGDDRLAVYIDGRRAAACETWWQPVEADVTALASPGEHVLAAFGENGGSIAALWIDLELRFASGRLARIVTDSNWRAHPWSDALPSADRWSVRPVHESGVAPHVFGPIETTEPWRSAGEALRAQDAAEAADVPALDAGELELLDGFQAELLYSVPKDEQGSWVVLCEDPRGRLYVSDQYGPLYRVTPPPPDDASAQAIVERVPADIGEAQGLCWAYDSLYVVVSSGGTRESGLYRVRDTDGDDQLDDVTCLRKFEGGGEHGPHGVVLGPDGRLWISGGNHTKLPEPIDSYRLPPTWSEDHLLPVIEDPNGHAVGIRAPGGWVVRTDENGASWELWAGGFRNAYDLAFDEEGELFTFDSDMEWDVGLPWYKPTRVLHVVSGADFGWRSGSANWPTDYPDTLPSVCELGLASPTGVVFGTGAKFPAKYQRAFFALDWAYGTIYAVHLAPKGASFAGTAEKFAAGKPFPVCDAIVGRDGAMYVVTGGRRSQSGLYRISWTKPQDRKDIEAEQVWTSLRDRSRAERMRRRDLEGNHEFVGDLEPHLRWPMWDSAVVWSKRELDDPDPFIRQAARVVLEHVDPSFLDNIEPRTPEGRLQLAIASMHAAPNRCREQPSTRPDSDLTAILRVDQLRLMRHTSITDDERAPLRDKLAPLFPSGDPRVDRELAMLLSYLDAPSVVEPLVAEVESGATQEEKIWAAYCLRVARSGWTPELRRRFFVALDALRTSATGGLSCQKYVEKIREQSIDALSDEEMRALADLVAPKSGATGLGTVPEARFVRAWTREEVDRLVREPLRGRSFESGKLAYAKALCAQCHRIGGEGGATGPDLTGAGSRFSRLDLAEAILEPSKAVSDQYQDVELVTRGGDLLVGRIEGERDGFVLLRRLPPSEELVELDAAEIDARRPHPLSRMPSALLDVLTEAEVADLFAFVLSGANPADPAFAR
jgi:putative heme-binding domain-containing protein